jgi:hypothetical protein
LQERKRQQYTAPAFSYGSMETTTFRIIHGADRVRVYYLDIELITTRWWTIMVVAMVVGIENYLLLSSL